MFDLILAILQMVTLLAAFIFGAMSLSRFTDDHPLYSGKAPKGFYLRPWRFKHFWKPPGHKYSIYSSLGFLLNGILIVVKYVVDALD